MTFDHDAHQALQPQAKPTWQQPAPIRKRKPSLLARILALFI